MSSTYIKVSVLQSFWYMFTPFSGGVLPPLLRFANPSLVGFPFGRQILEGLDFLHSEKIVHRDVKGAGWALELGCLGVIGVVVARR